jgi:hypothetical protein
LIELVSTTWLLHREVEPVTLRLAGNLLEVDIVNSVLATLYDICIALFIFIIVYIASAILVIRLFFFTPLVTRLPNQIYILQWMQQKFQDLAEAAPITHQVLKALLIHSIPGISSHYVSPALITRAIGLTKEKLSFIFKIIVISTLYITLYRLPVGSDQAFLRASCSPGQKMPGHPRPRYPRVGLGELR